MSELTTCNVCGEECESMAHLVVHVAKYHGTTTTDLIGGTYSDCVRDFHDEMER